MNTYTLCQVVPNCLALMYFLLIILTASVKRSLSISSSKWPTCI